VDPRYVGMMNGMLRQTLEIGTGRNAALAGRPAAGKTGTSQDFRDAWFIGYTRVLTAGVWFGNDDNKSMNRTTGGTLPAAAWNRFMTEALAGVPVAALPGNYRLHDPDNFEIAATALGDAAGMDAFLQGLGDDGFATDWPGASTGDPMTLGPGDATPERRRPNFFQRLFGGG
jgi:penicillin-binding protein 1A